MTDKTKVLVVEDEGVVAINVKMALLGRGYNVLPIAISGNSALLYAAQYHPHVVLMDIRLHGDMDGIDTASLIHNQYKIPIIYTSAHNDKETMNRVKYTEYFGFLVKPYEEEKLFAMIDDAVSTNALK